MQREACIPSHTGKRPFKTAAIKEQSDEESVLLFPIPRWLCPCHRVFLFINLTPSRCLFASSSPHPVSVLVCLSSSFSFSLSHPLSQWSICLFASQIF